ncbi:MAG TPA: 16S rRNA (guanine(527)-N(7))-methyltransferase RsmG [Burkholderiales bacterium]|nr:16S rRNA (guanine(527)-N(7))-methyltransferase RsmG [Burkholderiales bacterium]
MLEEALASGLDALHLPLDSEAQQKLLDYLALIEKWNRVYNLTAVREPRHMLTQHVLDSLAVAPHVAGRSLVDVGSGAGLPGIPLALALPRTHVTLVESSHKKSTFLNQALIELDLKNVEVVNARVESWDTPARFEVVISRALSDLAEFVRLAGHVCAKEGVLAAMKGVYPFDELAQLPDGYRLNKVIPLAVPGVAAERHLVLVEPA